MSDDIEHLVDCLRDVSREQSEPSTARMLRRCAQTITDTLDRMSFAEQTVSRVHAEKNALLAEVLKLREALQPFASAWNIAHASGNQNLGQLGAIARNEVSAHYFIKAAAALSPAPVVDAVKQGDA